MRSMVSFGKNIDLTLSQVVTLYSGGTGHCAFVHEPINAHGFLTLGPGQPLNADFLKNLNRNLRASSEMEWFPEHVVASTSEAIAWWTPAAQRPMFFVEDAGVDHLSGQLFPHPPLLWIARDGQLTLRALTENRRPTRNSAVAVAPYWNTEGTKGQVCVGSMKRPQSSSPSRIDEWVSGFFGSHFSHASGNRKLTAHPGGFVEMWSSLIRQNHFPDEYLSPLNATVGQVIEHA